MNKDVKYYEVKECLPEPSEIVIVCTVDYSYYFGWYDEEDKYWYLVFGDAAYPFDADQILAWKYHIEYDGTSKGDNDAQ